MSTSASPSPEDKKSTGKLTIPRAVEAYRSLDRKLAEKEPMPGSIYLMALVLGVVTYIGSERVAARPEEIPAVRVASMRQRGGTFEGTIEGATIMVITNPVEIPEERRRSEPDRAGRRGLASMFFGH
jgi:hypothetical protein